MAAETDSISIGEKENINNGFNEPKTPKKRKLHTYYLDHKATIDRRLFIIAFLAIPIINFIVFYLYVNIDSFLMAFQRPVYDNNGMHLEFSVENFTKIWTLLTGSSGAILREALINTLLFYVCGTFIGLPISILMAYFIYKKITCYRFFRFVAYLPSIITSSALVVLFKYAIGDGGVLDAWVTKAGGEFFYPLTREPDAIITILFYAVTFGYGGNLVILGGAMNSLNPQMLESAQIDGCNWFEELVYIILPSIWPTISTMLILGVASILGSTGPILAFTQGSNGTMTLSYYIYALVSGRGADQDLYLASAVGLCMTAVSFPLALIVKRLVYGKESD